MPFGQPMSFSPTSVTEVIFFRTTTGRVDNGHALRFLKKPSSARLVGARQLVVDLCAPSGERGAEGRWSAGVIASQAFLFTMMRIGAIDRGR